MGSGHKAPDKWLGDSQQEGDLPIRKAFSSLPFSACLSNIQAVSIARTKRDLSMSGVVSSRAGLPQRCIVRRPGKLGVPPDALSSRVKSCETVLAPWWSDFTQTIYYEGAVGGRGDSHIIYMLMFLLKIFFEREREEKKKKNPHVSREHFSSYVPSAKQRGKRSQFISN